MPLRSEGKFCPAVGIEAKIGSIVRATMLNICPLSPRSSGSSKWIQKFFQWIEHEEILKRIIITEYIPEDLMRIFEHKGVRLSKAAFVAVSGFGSCSRIVKIIWPRKVEILV